KRKIRVTTAINANVCRSYEPVARAMLDAGWEFMGHGVKQGAMHLLPDQREEIKTASGSLVSVPYTLELNDIPMMLIQHHESSAWLDRVRDQFDRLYLEGAKNPRVMAIAVHPYIHGVPHRIKYF